MGEGGGEVNLSSVCPSSAWGPARWVASPGLLGLTDCRLLWVAGKEPWSAGQPGSLFTLPNSVLGSGAAASGS